MKESTEKILRKYSGLFAEVAENVYQYFESMEADEKPCVEIEIYNKPRKTVLKFKSDLESLGFFVFRRDEMIVRKDSVGKDRMRHTLSLQVSKIKSISYWLNRMAKDGFWKNAGAVGILFGYPLKDVIEYVKRTGEDEIKL